MGWLRHIWRFLFWCYLQKKRNFNVLKTLSLNFKYLPLSRALRFPVFVYGPLLIDDDGGKIEILVPTKELKAGMIKVGIDFDLFSPVNNGTRLQLGGLIRFHGPFKSALNVVLGACKRSSIIEFGACVCIGSNCCVRAYKSIKIGEYTDIANNCKIYDTDFHPFRNIETGKVSQFTKEVLIGKCVFIAMGSCIFKGCILPDYSLVAAHSILNKNYSGPAIPPFIAGVPAVVCGVSSLRLVEKDLEIDVTKHFENSSKIIILHKGEPIDFEGKIGSFLS